MFKQKKRRKIHLSPRLARHSGMSGRTAKTFAVFIVLAALAAISTIEKEKNEWQNLSRADAVSGEVLGAHTSSPLDYTVQPGDTLIALSERFEVHWTVIVEENDLSAPYRLYPGQIIRIPISPN